jgi:SAM-dependent methyltransferase
MKWRRKARIAKLVAALPASDAIYYRVQRRFGSLRPGRHDPCGWLSAAARMARWISDHDGDVAGKVVLEVGTGRTVDLPMGLWLCGAARVITVDLNRYLSADLVAESLRFLRARPQAALACFGDLARHPGFAARFRTLLACRDGVDALLQTVNVEYVAPADAARLALPAASIDYHVSYAVLEHIPADVITAILVEARRLLRPEGLLVHVIDPSDHFAHDDASLTTVNFLRFSEREWQALAGNRFAYHNRLRAPTYSELFTRAGARILRQLEVTDADSLRALRNGFPVHESFRHMAPEKLAIRGLTLAATFGAAESFTAGAMAAGQGPGVHRADESPHAPAHHAPTARRSGPFLRGEAGGAAPPRAASPSGSCPSPSTGNPRRRARGAGS